MKLFKQQGFKYIACNKKGMAGELTHFDQLKEGGYESTVAAGLPVIKTCQDLCNTGDKVMKIEGVLSGPTGLLADVREHL